MLLIPILALAGSEFVALKGATVHTFEPGSAPFVATVLIENDRIVDIGPDVAIPADAQVVDLTGKHLLPGLVDGMVNFDAYYDRLYLGAGVTLVRDVGNDLGRIQVEQLREARERNPGPWIWSAGAALDGAPPATLSSIVMEDAAQAEAKLKVLFELEQPPDYLSFLPGLPKPAWETSLTAGHARRQVWGMLPRGVTFAEAVAAGQATASSTSTRCCRPARGGTRSRWRNSSPRSISPRRSACRSRRRSRCGGARWWRRRRTRPTSSS